MDYKIKGTIARIHGEDWLIVAQIEGGFCLAVRNGDIVPAKVFLVYCDEIIANYKVSEVTL